MSTHIQWGWTAAALVSIAIWVVTWWLIGWWSLLVFGVSALALGIVALRS
jgi:hypothetical protein